MSLPRSAVDKDINTAPLNGDIKLDIKELGLISALVPEINKAEGFIDADLKLAGNVSDPLISGAAKFVSQKISIPLAGIEYTNIKLNILHGKDGISIKGKLSVPQAGIYLTDLPEGTQSASDDVIIVSKGKPVDKEPEAAANMNLDLAIKLGNKVHVKAFGLETHLEGAIDIEQEPGQLMTANGEVATVDGTFRAYGQDLIIEQGRIFYAGGFIDDPGLSIKAGKDIDSTSVGVMVSGSATNILFETYSSDPNLSSKDITSLLITGQKFDASGSAQIYAGTELSKNLSVGVNLGGETGSEGVVRYKLGEKMHFEGTSTSEKSEGESLMKKLILFLTSLLLLPGICLSNQTVPEHSASPILKVMTLNLAHGRKDGFNQILLSQSKIKSNLSDIAKVLKYQDVDIVALQEADAPSWWSGDFNHVAWLAEQADYLTYIQSSHADSWFFSYGTGLLSQWAFTDSIKHTFQPSPPTLNKGFTVGQISWKFSNDAEPMLLDIISVHLDFSRQSVREQQTIEIKKVLAERHHAVIIMGDFNSDWFAKEKVIRELTKKGDYHVYRPEAQDLGTYNSNHRLDWIILSAELEFKSLAVLPDILSDHSAVVAEISIKNWSENKK